MDLGLRGILVRINKILSNSPLRSACTLDLKALTIPPPPLFEALESGLEMASSPLSSLFSVSDVLLSESTIPEGSEKK